MVDSGRCDPLLVNQAILTVLAPGAAFLEVAHLAEAVEGVDSPAEAMRLPALEVALHDAEDPVLLL